MMVQIMTEPRNSIYNQFREILKADGVDLVIEPEVFDHISDLAMEYKAGARSLKGIFERLMTDVLYVIPDNPKIRKVVIASLFEDAKFFGDAAEMPRA